jgi:hypothetical protein
MAVIDRLLFCASLGVLWALCAGIKRLVVMSVVGRDATPTREMGNGVVLSTRARFVVYLLPQLAGYLVWSSVLTVTGRLPDWDICGVVLLFALWVVVWSQLFAAYPDWTSRMLKVQPESINVAKVRQYGSLVFLWAVVPTIGLIVFLEVRNWGSK